MLSAGVFLVLSPLESGQQIVQIGGGELPLERLCRGVVAVFEGSEPSFDLVQVGEVVRCHSLSHLIRAGAISAILDTSEQITRRQLETIALDYAADSATSGRSATG